MIISKPYKHPPLDSGLFGRGGCVSFIFLFLAPTSSPDTWSCLVNVFSLAGSAIGKYVPLIQWNFCLSECPSSLLSTVAEQGMGRRLGFWGSMAEGEGSS